LSVIGKLGVQFSVYFLLLLKSVPAATSRRLTAATVKILDVFLLILSFRFAVKTRKCAFRMILVK
jgi:hypothetical protein